MRQEIGGLGGTSGGDSTATDGSIGGGESTGAGSSVGSTGVGASVGGTGRPVGANESLGGDQRTGPVRDGQDFVCPNCGAEIRVRHAGDSADDGTTTFTCICGTAMRPEQRAA